ncbi:MAG: hypothetical protein ABIK73_06925 [candidate division WOR-3 bacterium]
MCHVVNGMLPSANGYYRVPNLGRYFGLKKMYFDENSKVLRSAYFLGHVYDVYMDDWFGYKCLCVREDPKIQTVSFRVNTFEGSNDVISYTPVIGKATCGMHIAPFSLHVLENCIEDLRDTYIVMFEPIDVVFYDGKDISVKRFYILNSNDLDEMIKNPTVKKIYYECFEHNDYLIDKIVPVLR